MQLGRSCSFKSLVDMICDYTMDHGNQVSCMDEWNAISANFVSQFLPNLNYTTPKSYRFSCTNQNARLLTSEN